MPTNYAGIMNGNNDLATITWGADTPTPGLWGAEFVAGCNALGLTPAANMGQISQRFHNALRQRNWRWNPERAGNSWRAGQLLLDETQNDGECAFVARALAMLVNIPAPWGFGAGGATVRTYDGAHAGGGFIAAHGANALPGAEPNITRENGRTLQGYYLWGDHKVVEYNTAFYDPCYNVQYPNLGAMAAVDLQQVRVNANLNDLRWYDTQTWRGWFANIGRAIYDVIWNARHRVQVFQAVGGPGAVNGYYMGWEEQWDVGFSAGGRGIWYGPFVANPLAR